MESLSSDEVFKNLTLGTSISYITQLSKRDYLNFAVQPMYHNKRLGWDELIFSDQWDDYGTLSQQSSVIKPNTGYNIFDIGSGILWTRHGKYNENSEQTLTIGFSGHHLAKPIESFYKNQNDDSRYPIKLTFHGQFIAGIPDYKLKSIRFAKIMFRHQTHIKTFNKTEVGGMITLANKIQLESGVIYRRAYTYNKEHQRESLLPIIRLRFATLGNTGLELSYSYDYTISKLNHANTWMTHELSLNLYWMTPKARVCPAEGPRGRKKWMNNKKWENVEFNRGKYNRFGKKNRGNW